MARIRSIKPEYWSDATIATFDYFTRLFYIALWNFADDEGRGRALCKELAGFAFPLDDDLPNSEVERALQTIAASGRIMLYESSGVRHFQIMKWADHQKVDRASKSRLPEPPTDYRGKSRDTIDDSLTELSCSSDPRSLESGVRNLESGGGSEERVDAPAHAPSFNDIETDLIPAGATQIPRGDPGELIRAASSLLGRATNLNSNERAEWRKLALVLLEHYTVAQILAVLRAGILRKSECKQKYLFRYLKDDVPDFYTTPDVASARQAQSADDAVRAEQEAQERADAERERIAKSEAELEERRRKAKAAVVPPPPLAESEKPCLLQSL